MTERLILAAGVLLIVCIVTLRAHGQDVASSRAINATEKVAIEKLARVALVSPDTPDKAKGKPQTCHVWIDMSETDAQGKLINPRDQIIVWFETTPTQKDIDAARTRELDMRAKMAEDRAKMQADAAKMEVPK